MPYLSHTDEERRRMLGSIGVDTIDDLFAAVPPSLRLQDLHVPTGLSEYEVLKLLRELAEQNTNLESIPSFLGGGAYFGYVPAAVGAITGRAEFYTSYTPYQPEVSQGTLQVIYEFQSMIAMLTALDVANASLYDGATAVAEAAAMALGATGRNRIAIVDSVNPQYRQVLDTYAEGIGYGIDTISVVGGGEIELSEDHAALIVQNPDYLGSIVAMSKLSDLAHEHEALFIAVVDPVSLALLAPPGEYGADIAVGEAQSLGGWLSYGGPYLGFIACTSQFQRRVPGRIAGASVDDRGQRAFVLTLQTREQHIRRERATSNICTNEALVALGATVYLALMGKQGLQEVANQSAQKAHYAARALSEIPGFELARPTHFFREFVVRCPGSCAEFNRLLLQRGILGGIDIGADFPDVPSLQNCMLFACTELTTRADVDRLVDTLRDFVREREPAQREAQPAGVS